MNPNTLRGDGLFRAHRALAALQEDPQQLEQARVRFSNSPPSYRSHQSHNSTRSQSPNPPNEEQRRCEERKWHLIGERRASRPYEQLEAQRSEEEAWLIKADQNGIRTQSVHVDFYRLAYETVRRRWEEQGIWSDKWNDMADGVWKHERPLESEPDLDTDTEAEAYTHPPLFSGLSREPKARRLKNDKDKQQIAEQRAKRERYREASRPFHQFVYQVSTERERIQEESGGGAVAPFDINTIAYERVKDAWIKRKIWNHTWGILPGMTWKHEDPLVVDVANAANEPAPVDAIPPESGSYKAYINTVNGTHSRRILTRPTPAHLASSVTESWQRPPADADSPGMEDRDSKRSPSELDSPHLTVEQSTRARWSKSSRKDRQTHALDGPSLGPVHQAKVSKTSTRKHTRPRRRVRDPSSPRPEVIEQPPQPAGILPRRSPRLQTPGHGLANDLNGRGVAGRRNATSRTRPQRSGVSLRVTKSTKLQGIAKGQRSRTTR